MLRQLGAEVRTLDLWDDFANVVEQARPTATCGPWCSRPASGPTWPPRRSARRARCPSSARRPTVVTLPPRQIARFDPSSGFDDFIVTPYVPAELYARIRALEWRRSEFATEERAQDRRARHRPRGARGERRRPPGHAHGEGVRAPRVPRREPRPGLLARDAARARVGQPLRRRRAHGRHPRAPAPRQARRRAAARDAARRGLQAARTERSQRRSR